TTEKATGLRDELCRTYGACVLFASRKKTKRDSSLRDPAHKKTCAGKNRVAAFGMTGWGGLMSEPFEAQGKLKVRPPKERGEIHCSLMSLPGWPRSVSGVQINSNGEQLSAEEADCSGIAGAARQLIREPPLAFARIIVEKQVGRAGVPASPQPMAQFQAHARSTRNIANVPTFLAV